MSENSLDQTEVQAVIQAAEDRYRTACRELARLSAISNATAGYSEELEQAMYPHAVNRLESRGQLVDMGRTNVQLHAIELAEKMRGQRQAAHELRSVATRHASSVQSSEPSTED